MYDPSSSNENQLQALIDKIREKRDRLQQQKQELELMITDLGDWETRSLESLEELQKNGDLT